MMYTFRVYICLIRVVDHGLNYNNNNKCKFNSNLINHTSLEWPVKYMGMVLLYWVKMN